MKEIDETSKVGWITHTYGPVDPNIYFNHMGSMLKFSHECSMAFLGLDKCRVADARNILVEAAKKINCTHLLIVDADTMIPTHTLGCLSKNESLIASGLITKRKPPYSQVGFVKADKNYHLVDLPLDGKSYLVDVPAMGCTLIDMSVFDKLEEPYFVDTLEVSEEGKIYNKRSDVNFFEKCQKAGIKMVIDTRVLVGHLRDPVPIYPHTIPDVKQMNKINKIRLSDDAIEWQAHVYAEANSLLKSRKSASVLDLGCGNPIKLINAFNDIDYICGVDYMDKLLSIVAVSNSLDKDVKTKWIGHDLGDELNLQHKFDIVIAADVFEHLDNTSVFFKTVKNHMSEDSLLVLSTPEASTTMNDNPLHVKEYKCEEMTSILISEGFEIIKAVDYPEIFEKEYSNNVFVCKLSKENKNGDSNTS